MTTVENDSAPRARRSPLPYVLIVPAVVALGLALGYPLVRQVLLSFQEFGLRQQFGNPPEWVGLENYRELVTDPYLWKVTLRSIVFCLVNAAVTMAIGVALALLMQHMSKGIRILVQAGLLLAWAMPVVAALTVWQWLFDTQYGVVNWALNTISGTDDWTNHSWLLNPWSFFFVLTIIVVWQGIPFVAFTTYAALGQVPGEVLEAAALDGTTGFKRFRFVVFPYLRSVLLVILVLQIIWNLRIFTQVYALQSRGGIASETNVLGTYMFRQGPGDFGFTSAIGVVMVLLLLVLSWGYVRSTLKEEEL